MNLFKIKKRPTMRIIPQTSIEVMIILIIKRVLFNMSNI